MGKIRRLSQARHNYGKQTLTTLVLSAKIRQYLDTVEGLAPWTSAPHEQNVSRNGPKPTSAFTQRHVEQFFDIRLGTIVSGSYFLHSRQHRRPSPKNGHGFPTGWVVCQDDTQHAGTTGVEMCLTKAAGTMAPDTRESCLTVPGELVPIPARPAGDFLPCSEIA